MANDYLKGVNQGYSYGHSHVPLNATPAQRAGFENARRQRDAARQQQQYRPSGGGGGGSSKPMPTLVKVSMALGALAGAIIAVAVALGMEKQPDTFGMIAGALVVAIIGGGAGLLGGYVLMVVLAIAGGGTKAAGWVRQRKWAKIIAIPAIIIVLLFAVITFTGGW